MVKFASKIGFFIFFLPLHLPSSFKKGTKESKYFSTGEETSGWLCQPQDFPLVDTVYHELLKMKKRGLNIYCSHRFLKESINFIKYGYAGWKRIYAKCATPGSLFFITTDGHFDICGSNRFNDVSLLAPDFPLIFHSQEFRIRAQEKADICKGCMCAMADTFLWHKDLTVFLDRFITHIKMMTTGPRRLNLDEILKLIDSL